MDKPNLVFELGDIAYCPYYQYKGIIVEIKKSENPEIIPYYIKLQDPNKPEGHSCTTTLKTSTMIHPQYLQLICKKQDYENIAKKTIFGNGD